MTITSNSNKKIKNLVKLLSNKERIKQKLFLSSDLNLISKAYKNKLLKEIYSKVDINMPYIKVSDDILKKITDKDFVAVISFIFPSNSYSDRIIYLDEINDPANLGKIIYLMTKYGFKDLVLSNNCVSLYNEKCLEIVGDKIFDVKIHYGDISFLKRMENRYQIVSTGLKSSKYLDELILKDKYIIVFGNEARGVNSEIIDISDDVIKIKINNIDSLNVAVAASIVLDNIK